MPDTENWINGYLQVLFTRAETTKLDIYINSYNDGLNRKTLTVSIIAETYENGEFKSKITPILFGKIIPIFFSMKIR